MDKQPQSELARVYEQRFGPLQEYRRRVWETLVRHFFQSLVPETGKVLDLGCGYGEFINAIRAREKAGMDMNEDSGRRLRPEVRFIQQDCAQAWPFGAGELDLVFSSNFFEHLPDKAMLGRTLEEAFRCLKPAGRLIAVGPNIRFTRGSYWDFWDHYLPLTERSLCEGLRVRGFQIERCHARFLPYRMTAGPQYPMWVVAAYVRVPLLWKLAGQQFLVIARKEE